MADGANWLKVGPGLDIAGEGDVHHIADWAKEGKSIDDLKKMVIDKGWSGFAMGKAGSWASKGVWFKKVTYDFVPSKLRPNALVGTFYIHRP